MVVLKGTLANDPAAGDTSLQLTVLHTNRWGRGYKQASQPATVERCGHDALLEGRRETRRSTPSPRTIS